MITLPFAPIGKQEHKLSLADNGAAVSEKSRNAGIAVAKPYSSFIQAMVRTVHAAASWLLVILATAALVCHAIWPWSRNRLVSASRFVANAARFCLVPRFPRYGATAVLGTLAAMAFFSVTAIAQAQTITVVAESSTVRIGREAVFTFTRTGSTNSTLSVDLSWTGESHAYSNSANPPMAIEFARTSATREVTVKTGSAEPGDPPAQMTVTISAGSGYTVGSPAMATVSVEPPDRIGRLSLAAGQSATVNEGDGIDFVITLTEPGVSQTPAAATEDFTLNYLVLGSTCDEAAPLAGLNDVLGYSGGDLRLQGSVDFAIGDIRKTVTVATVLDLDNSEGDESVCFDIGSLNTAPSGAFHTYNDHFLEVVIRNVTPPSITMTVALDQNTVQENDSGSTMVTGTVTLSPAIQTSYFLTVAHYGTATQQVVGNEVVPGADYTRPRGSALVVEPGMTEVQFNFSVLGDLVPEEDETIVTHISSAAVSNGALHSVTTTIVDDDPLKTVSVVSSSDIDEGAAGETHADVTAFTVRIDNPADAAVSVDYSLGGTATGQFGSTAVSGADFIMPNAAESSGTLTIPANETAVKVPVNVVGDADVEADETLTIALSNLRYADGTDIDLALAEDGVTASFAILNDDTGTAGAALPVLSIEHLRRPESQALNLRVNVIGEITQNISANFEFTGGTATPHFGTTPPPEADFRTADRTGTVSFSSQNPGTTTFYIALLVVPDDRFEPDETVVLTLSNPVNATIEKSTATALTILNDDMQISIAGGSVDEGDSTDSASLQSMEFQLTLSGAAKLDGIFVRSASVKYRISGGTAVRGEDYETRTEDPTMSTDGYHEGRISFFISHSADPTAESVQETLSFSILGDMLAESDETVVVELFGAVGGDIDVSRAVFTIANDDDPVVWIEAPPDAAEGDQGTTDITFQVKISPAPGSGKTVTVGYTLGGTASASSDYQVAGGAMTVTFTQGQTSQDVVLAVSGDTTAESDETVVVTLANSVGAVIGDGRGTASATILDDDTPVVLAEHSFAAATSVAEGDSGSSDLTFTVTRTGMVEGPSSVQYTLFAAGSTAISGTDFTAFDDGTLVFAAGATSQTFTVSVTGDNLNEGDETVSVMLYNPVGGVVASGGGIGVGTIVDDDPLTLTIDSPSVDEGDANDMTMLEFTVTLASRSAQPVTVEYSVTTEGTATVGTDFEMLADGSITFNAGEVEKMISLTLTGDTVIEDDETIVVRLFNPNGGASFTGGASVMEIKGTGTILDDDAPVLTVDESSVMEGADGQTATLTFTVRMSRVWAMDVTVNYAVTGGTAAGEATDGEDFTPKSGSLTFAGTSGGVAGETSKTVDIAVLGDNFSEPDETVTLRLSNPTGGGVIKTPNWTGTIIDDDGLPVFSIDSPTVSEGESGTTNLVFTVTKTGMTRLDSSVSYSVADGATNGATGGTGPDADYAPVPDGTLRFAHDVTEQTITVRVNGDDLAEEDEKVTVTLSGAMQAELDGGAGTLESTGTISNDDLLILSIDSPSVAEGSTGVITTMNFTVTLAARPTQLVDVTFEIITDPQHSSSGTATFGAGEDYTVTSMAGILAFDADTAAPQTRTIPIMVIGDDESEMHETVVIRLYAPTSDAGFEGGSTVTEIFGTGTIRNDDSPTFFVNEPEVAEGDAETTSLLAFTVTMSPVWDEVVTVNYAVTGGTATAGEDFRTANGTLTYAVGETSKPVNVTVLGDNEIENDETVTLTLSSPSQNALISQAVWPGVILTDDYELTVTANPSTVAEPISGTSNISFMVTMRRDLGRSVEMAYAFEGGTAVEGADFSDIMANAGQLVFAMGTLTQTVRIAVNADIVDETDETVSLAVLNAAGTRQSQTAASATITPPQTPAGSDVVPDVVVEAESLRTGMSGGETTATIQMSLTGSRSFETIFDWRVTRIVDEVEDESALARADGGLTGPTAMVEVLADSTLSTNAAGVNEQVRVAATDASTSIEATLSGSVSSGELLGFEIFNLNCPANACAVTQSGEAQIRGAQLSDGSSPARTVLAGVFSPRDDSDKQKEILTHALAGFGRAVATGIVGGVWRRADAHRSGDFSSSALLGGRALDTAAVSSGDAGRAAKEVAELMLGVEVVEPLQSPLVGVHDVSQEASGGYSAWRDRAGLVNSERLTTNSRFAISLDEGRSAGPVTFWGEAALSGFASEPEEGAEVDGSATSMLFGLDWRRGELLLGVAIHQSKGDSDYTFGGAGTSSENGSLSSSLTGAAPYLHWMGPNGLGVWGSIGTGSGSLELDSESDATETDLSLSVMAFGAKRPLSRWGFADLSLRGDFFQSSVTAAAASDFEELDASASRLRVAVEGVIRRGDSESRQLVNRLELGARLDSGDGGEGAGVDFAGEVNYALPGHGLDMTGRVGLLLLHGQSGFQEWGAGLNVAYSPGGGGNGLQLLLEPQWNVPRSGVAESMWSDASLDARSFSDSAGEAGASMRARVGYGVGAIRQRVLVTPYGEVKTADNDQKLRMGVEMLGNNAGLGRMKVELYGERHMSESDETDDRLLLETRLGL